ncbi:MAG: hypothetical protein LBO63_06910 [Oscillospiraceae bacterium]|nr:hypothetical protein [Oscillospiraceae bacterium]
MFLKTVGDQIEFGFRLTQDIDVLNGNLNIKIVNDNMSIEDPPLIKTNIGRGTLVIVKTDYQGNKTQSEYTNFLEAKSVDADTKVGIFEEGDYRVVLVYEIQKVSGLFGFFKNYYNYRMESSFKIRNANSMLFIQDTKTGSELANEDFTESGFKIDLAQSHYLHVSAKKEVLNDTGDGIVEDIRFNTLVSDGTVFTAPGKYTLTVSNDYNDMKTPKVIYIGVDYKIVKASVVNNTSVLAIKQALDDGATLSDNWNIINAPESLPTRSPELPTLPAQTSPESLPDNSVTPDITPEIPLDNGEQNAIILWSGIGTAILIIVLGVGAFVYAHMKKKHHEEDKL